MRFISIVTEWRLIVRNVSFLILAAAVNSRLPQKTRKDMQKVSGGFKNLPIVLAYNFKPELPRPQGENCVLIPYSY
jgi:hypothetical protein